MDNRFKEHLPAQFALKPGAENYPLMILPQVSNVCNSRCVHCWFNAKPKLRSREKVNFMSPDLFRRIVDETAEHTKSRPLVRVTGTGEPFLMPRLTELLVYACGKKNVRVAVITNGSLLTPDRAAKLLDAGLEAVEISADAADQRSYERIRKGLKFDILLRNIEFLLKYREQSGARTKILVSFVENPTVVDPDQVELFWKKRVDNVIRRKYLTYGQISDRGYSKVTYLPPDQRVPCPYPFERMVILANGNVTFCNFDVADGFYMGNVNTKRIADIWRNDKFEAWRRLVLDRRFEDVPLCAKCEDWKYKSWKHNFFKVLRTSPKKKSRSTLS